MKTSDFSSKQIHSASSTKTRLSTLSILRIPNNAVIIIVYPPVENGGDSTILNVYEFLAILSWNSFFKTLLLVEILHIFSL